MMHSLAKEAIYYKQELKENETKVRQMEKDGDVDGKLKQMRDVLAETAAIIPHSEANLRKNLEELDVLVKTFANGGDGGELAADNEWMVAAGAILAEHGLVRDDDTGGGAKQKGDEAEPATSVEGLADGEAF